jgi:1-phosphofructokinase family hexose kinase
MILTVSPNPALDRVHITQGFQPGDQSRAVRTFLQAGGSGMHAAHVAQALGVRALAMGILGGNCGMLWSQQAIRQSLPVEMLSIDGETRESFCLIDLDLGSQVEAVETGPQVEPGSLEALLARLEARLPHAELVILSGSLPPGLPMDSYARMVRLARQASVPVILDASGEPLRLALQERPCLIKPNLSEFDSLIGSTTANQQERAQASQELAQRQGVVIALSMAAEGVILTSPADQWRILPPAVAMHLPGGTGQNVIGCGDALVGALAAEYCRSKDLLASAVVGVAAAHQNLSTFGVPEIDAIQVRQLVSAVRVEKVMQNL